MQPNRKPVALVGCGACKAAAQPRIVVAVGAMAAQTLLASTFSITRERGQWRRLAAGTEAFATWHPSAILSTPDERRASMYRQLVRDLSQISKRAGVRE